MRNPKINTFSKKRPRQPVQTPSIDLLAIRAFREIQKYVDETGRPAPTLDIIGAADVEENVWPKVARRMLGLGLAVKSEASEWAPASGLEGSLASWLEQIPEWPLFTRIAPREMSMSAARLRAILKTLEKSVDLRALPLPGQRGAWAVTRQRVPFTNAMADDKIESAAPRGGKQLSVLLEPGAVFIIGALAEGPLRAADLSKRAAEAGAERPTTASGSFATLIRAGLVVPLPRETRRHIGARAVSEHARWALSADGLTAAAAMGFPAPAVSIDPFIENAASAA